MYCSKCGAELADNSKFCPYCGGAIVNNVKDNPNNPETIKYGAGRWILFVLLIITACTYVPSFSSALFLLAAMIIAPFKKVQDFCSHYVPKKKNRNWIIAGISLIATMLIK